MVRIFDALGYTAYPGWVESETPTAVRQADGTMVSGVSRTMQLALWVHGEKHPLPPVLVETVGVLARIAEPGTHAIYDFGTRLVGGAVWDVMSWPTHSTDDPAIHQGPDFVRLAAEKRCPVCGEMIASAIYEGHVGTCTGW